MKKSRVRHGTTRTSRWDCRIYPMEPSGSEVCTLKIIKLEEFVKHSWRSRYVIEDLSPVLIFELQLQVLLLEHPKARLCA